MAILRAGSRQARLREWRAQLRLRTSLERNLTMEKGESMEVCFVSGGVREFVEEQVESYPERFPDAPRPEPSRIIDGEGELLGHGQPYYRYTVGQRRGLGIAAAEKLYVLGVDPERNEQRVFDSSRAFYPD